MKCPGIIAGTQLLSLIEPSADVHDRNGITFWQSVIRLLACAFSLHLFKAQDVPTLQKNCTCERHRHDWRPSPSSVCVVEDANIKFLLLSTSMASPGTLQCSVAGAACLAAPAGIDRHHTWSHSDGGLEPVLFMDHVASSDILHPEETNAGKPSWGLRLSEASRLPFRCVVHSAPQMMGPQISFQRCLVLQTLQQRQRASDSPNGCAF